MKLRRQKARLAHSSLLQTKPPPSTFKPTTRRPRRKYDTQVDERGKRVVVIDGTVYEFEGDGKKLKRMDGGSFSFSLFLSFLYLFDDHLHAPYPHPNTSRIRRINHNHDHDLERECRCKRRPDRTGYHHPDPIVLFHLWATIRTDAGWELGQEEV